MRVAFLGHDQPTDGNTRPSGGYISKSEAEALVRLCAVERISQKRIRAFPPDSAFKTMGFQPIQGNRLPSGEIPGIRFVPPATDLRPRVSRMKAGWDWSKEVDYLPTAISA